MDPPRLRSARGNVSGMHARRTAFVLCDQYGRYFSKMADGSGTEQQIYKFKDPIFLTSITPDGRTLAGEQLSEKLGWDVVVLHLKDNAGQVDGDPVPFVSTPALE